MTPVPNLNSDRNSRLKRNPVDPQRAYGVFAESEPDGDGGVANAITFLLTASECPIGCHMCDLWQNTLTTKTPAGAIPAQIAAGLSELAPQQPNQASWIKLYNSGNFFDPRSIPTSDYEAIADQCSEFSRVVVENHPRFGAQRVKQFRDLLAGRLEVAVGLETVQPRWLDRLNKQMTRADFERYAHWLLSEGVDLRVFLIVGVPGVSVSEAIRWARLSVKFACRAGARHVSLIPARAGHGWNGLASSLPDIDSTHLCEIQEASLSDVSGECVVTVDLWDVQGDNRAALQQMNRTQKSTT